VPLSTLTAIEVIKEAERSDPAGIPALQILRTATKDAEEHLGAYDLGAIASRKLAGMILVDGDPATNMSALRRVSTVSRTVNSLLHKGRPVACCDALRCIKKTKGLVDRPAPFPDSRTRIQRACLP
jgi:cytosine/adenosine deaminase-related metal-dependent hydrolase